MIIGFALLSVVRTNDGDCCADKTLSEKTYKTREECMSDKKCFNEKFIVCGEVKSEV